MTPDERNMKQSETCRGVSPTVGVVLMVLITIILASVIGAYVLMLGDQISEPADVCIDNGGVALGQYNTGEMYDYCYYEDNDTLTDIHTGEVVIQGEPG